MEIKKRINMTKDGYINDLKEEYKNVSRRYLPLLYIKIKELEKLKTVTQICKYT